jgi:RNA polymerase sigma-70 factor (ECF subfamily)
MGSGTVRDDKNDQELMARVQAGDVRAFELLYTRYAHPLLNFFHQMCFDRAAAEDYLQETFLRVWRARASYRPIGKVSTWLFEIAKNYWFNEREKIRRRPFATGAGGDEGQAQLSLVPDPADAAPADAARSKEIGEAVGRAVAELSDKLRAAFVLARYQQLPYAEISEILEIPVGTVKSRVALAEKLLRERLGSYLEE